MEDVHIRDYKELEEFLTEPKETYEKNSSQFFFVQNSFISLNFNKNRNKDFKNKLILINKK